MFISQNIYTMKLLDFFYLDTFIKLLTYVALMFASTIVTTEKQGCHLESQAV